MKMFKSILSVFLSLCLASPIQAQLVSFGDSSIDGAAATPASVDTDTLVVGTDPKSLDSASVLTSSGAVVFQSTYTSANMLTLKDSSGNKNILFKDSSVGGVIELFDDTGATILWTVTDDSGGGALNQLRDSGGNVDIRLSASTLSTYFRTGQNFGIGTITPDTDFDVEDSTGTAQMFLQGETGAELRISGDITNDAATDAFIQFEEGTTDRFALGYDGSADYLAIDNGTGLGAAPLVVVESGGDVGINDASPDAGLEVKQKAADTFVLAVTSASDTTGDLFAVTNTGRVGVNEETPNATFEVAAQSDIAQVLQISSANASTPLLVVEGGGRVGVLNQTPDASMEIAGQAVDSITLLVSSADASTSMFQVDADGNVGINDASPDAGLEVKQKAADTFVLAVTSASDTTGDLFAVLPGGNVGIGTSVPDRTLLVGDGTGAPSVGINGPASGSKIGYNIEEVGSRKASFQYDSTFKDLIITNHNGGAGSDIQFDTQDSGVYKLVITHSGDVGVNDTSPDAGLEVRQKAADTFVLAVTSASDTTGDLFAVLPDGKVGIGVAAPISLLDVGGAAVFGAAATKSTMTTTGGYTPHVDGQIIIPLKANDAASPGLAFGDGDSGFYETSDDQIYLSIAGALKFLFRASGISAQGAGNSWNLNYEVPSSINPVYSFVSDTETGIGRSGAGALSLISTGVNALEVESGGAIGINETSPDAQLEIAGKAANAFTLLVSSADASTSLFSVAAADGDVDILGDITWGAAGTRSTATAAGNLDLGGMLDVTGAATLDSTLNVAGNIVGTAQLDIQNTSSADFKIFSDTDNDGANDVRVCLGTDGTSTCTWTFGMDASNSNAYTLANSNADLNTNPRLVVETGGAVFIGDTANTGMTVGLTVNQSTNDDSILDLKSGTDVSHSMTSIAEADTYGIMVKSAATSGGLRIRGLSDTDANALRLDASIGDNNPTDSTPAIILSGSKYNAGTNVTTLADAETVMEVRNNNTTLMTLFGNAIVRFANVADCDALTPGAVGELCTENDATTPIWVSTSTAAGGFAALALQ